MADRGVGATGRGAPFPSGPVAAAFVVAEMLLFTALNLSSGGKGLGAFVACGRFSLKPLS